MNAGVSQMQYEQVIPGELSSLEKKILLEVRTMKQVDPTFPITKASLARRFGESGREVREALRHLHNSLHLVGPLVLDSQDVELTQLGEEFADQLADDGVVPQE